MTDSLTWLDVLSMSPLILVFRSLVFYRKSHLAVAMGVAICTMVITGALIVGDSVRSSLEEVTLLRLGKTEHVFSGIDRFFRSSLAGNIRKDLNTDAAPLLHLNGFATSQGGNFRVNNVQVLGVDRHFSSFLPDGHTWSIPADNEAYISENLANRLQVEAGDVLVLRVEKASQIPKNAPFVSDTENQISIRLVVARILSPDELGHFNLNASQIAPFNVFVSLSFLNSRMELADKANKILIGGGNASDRNAIREAIKGHWTLEDMALRIIPVLDGDEVEIRSERVFLDSSTVSAIREAVPGAENILTYMVNSLRRGDREIPYSFVSAGPFLTRKTGDDYRITINSWTAKDIDAAVGDSIEISYFVIGPLRQLREESRWFTVAAVVDIEGDYADSLLMPDLPGLSDAGSCRDWEAGVPIDLNKIRDKDEDYWNQYRGTPKAFIAYETGKALWENRFGVSTAIRIPASALNVETLEANLAALFSPESLGFAVRSVKEEGLSAARGGVDFGQLFMALSFFLLLAGIILMALLFELHLERRTVEMGTLQAIGYRRRVIKSLLLYEGWLVALPGVIVGGILALAYNKIIFYALNTVWYDIVRTSTLKEVISMKPVMTGMLVSLALVSVVIWFNIHTRLKLPSSHLQKNLYSGISGKRIRRVKNGAWFAAITAIAWLIYTTIIGQSLNTGVFFISGALLLLAGIGFFYAFVHTDYLRHGPVISPGSLALKNLSRNPLRSFRIAVLFALGTFIIIAIGLNRKDPHRDSGFPASGTGGFQFYMETTIPVLRDLNNPEVRMEQGIERPVRFVQMRRSDGDDASCLNLNRVVSPRILGIPSEEFTGRFSFIRSTEDLDPESPWISLKTELPGGIVPAVIDQTVLQWGLGKKPGDTLVYLNEAGAEMKLKIVGGLANSIFQGHVLVDEQLFLKHFPSSSGTHVFLVDGGAVEVSEIQNELVRAFRNEGLELQSAADRLAMFNQVENTYLSIFMLLGGLAMILGTVGLGVSLARNLQDREAEMGIMRAMGYRRSWILRIITHEHLILLLAGALTGTATAFVATLPSILSEFVQASWLNALVIVALILLNGFIWIYAIARYFLRKNLMAALRNE